MSEELQATEPKRLHPLPGFCWMWLVAGIFVAGIGALIVHSCIFPAAELLEKLPKEDPRWMEFWIIGIVDVLIGLTYVWFWHRFAVRANLTRKTWHIGTGLMLVGGLVLMLTGWAITGFWFLVTIAVWTQGHTRQFFERA